MGSWLPLPYVRMSGLGGWLMHGRLAELLRRRVGRLGWHLKGSSAGSGQDFGRRTWVLAVELLFSDVWVIFRLFWHAFLLLQSQDPPKSPLRCLCNLIPLGTPVCRVPWGSQCLPSSLLLLHLPPASCFALTQALACFYYLFELAALCFAKIHTHTLHPVLRCTALKASLPFTRAAIATAGDATARPSWLGPSAQEQYLLQAFSAPSR